VTSIVLHEVSVVHRGRPVLDRVSLTMTSEQPAILVGPNGAGKSTLLYCILGLAHPQHGQVTIDGTSVLDLSPRARAEKVAWLPQRPHFDEPLSVASYVATARYRFGESPAQSRQAVEESLGRVGAESLADRNVMTLSGGERQRVEFAALIAQRANVLLLDEPGNHLDPAQQAQNHECLQDLLEQGAALIMVTHDLNLLGHLSSARPPRVIGLREGRVVFDVLFDAPTLGEHLTELYGVSIQCLELSGRRVFLPVPRCSSVAEGAS
jgi:iron complex transport system ATP-binding protein